MATVNHIEGTDRVLRAIQRLQSAANREKNVSVSVGYNAAYAIYVHENKEMKLKGEPRTGKHPSGQARKGNYWDPPSRGQSKFLEQPLRENRNEIGAVVRKSYKRTNNLAIALTMGGLLLQRLSQLLVPVDTVNLKGSAFTEVDK